MDTPVEMIPISKRSNVLEKVVKERLVTKVSWTPFIFMWYSYDTSQVVDELSGIVQ
jgi:hypothetical protein